METVAAKFERLAAEVETARRIAYPLAELNDLLTAAPPVKLRNSRRLPSSTLTG